MLYDAIHPLVLYKSQSKFRPPVANLANTSGKGNVVFLLTPSIDDTFNMIRSPFFDQKGGLYHYYYTDLIYRKTVGTRRIVENIRSTFPTKFMEELKGTNLRLIRDNAKIRHFEANFNTLVDLGHWMEIYFKNRRKLNPDMLCYNFFSFLEDNIMNPIYDNYSKIIYVPLEIWSNFKKCDFGTKKDCLNDPISLLLRAMIRKANAIEPLKDFTFIIADASNGEILKIPGSLLTGKNYNKIRSRISQMSSVHYQEDEEIETEANELEKEVLPPTPSDSVPNIDPSDKTRIKNMNQDDSDTTEDLSSPVNSSKVDKNDVIKIIASKVKEEIISDKKDIQNDLENDPEFREFTKAAGVDDFSSDIDQNVIDNDDEILQRVSDRVEDMDTEDIEFNMEEIADEVEEEIKDEVYMPKIIPQKTAKIQERLNYLAEQQEEVLHQSIEQIKSKVITEQDVSSAVKSINRNITHIKYANFDKDYIRKRYEADIDMAVSALSQAEHPLFIIEKESEDTSSPLSLKKTMIYKLKDENNKVHTLRFDIPLFIDDRYPYLNGAKKNIVKQFLLKPIAKTEEDTVQIVSLYRKIFVRKKGDFTDNKVGKLKKFIMKHGEDYNLKIGNCNVKNRDGKYRYGNDFAFFAKNITSFEIDNDVFLFDLKKLEAILNEHGHENINMNNCGGNGNIPIGYRKRTYELITQSLNDGESIADIILSRLPDNLKKQILKEKPGSNTCYASMKLNAKEPPVALFMVYCVGLKEVLRITGIKHQFYSNDEEMSYDPFTQDIIPFMDGALVYDITGIGNSMLMNGLKRLKTETLKMEEMDEKDAILDLFSRYIDNRGDAFKLDRIRDFMIDPKTKEILNDFKLPTTLPEILWLACKMLCDNFRLPENCMLQCRVRGPEIIQQIVYKQVVDVAYKKYHNSIFKSKPSKVSLKGDEIIKNLLLERTVDAKSSLNPIYEAEETHAITFRGTGGINLDDAMTFQKRAYDDTMIGIAALSSSPDANTGINRQLTFEPNITSTLGYLDITDLKDVDNLSNNNLFSPSELLSPPGVRHDDGQRTSMAFKQSKYMVMTDGASPVLIGNKMESVLPYYLSREFIVVAKDDGEIIDEKEGVYIIKYKDGTYDSFDSSLKTLKNSSSGFFINVQLDSKKKVGDKVKKDEVIACDKRAFTKNRNDKSASMNIGVLAKVGIYPSFDEYEDSAPISKRLSEKLAITMTTDEVVTLKAGSTISHIVKVGDSIKSGDPLIVYDESVADPDMAEIIAKFKESYGENTIVSNYTSAKADHTGTITNIKVFSSVDPEELSPSLKKILNEYHMRLQNKIDILTKYQNPNDTAYYKCNTLIDEVPERIDSGNGKIHGQELEDEVQIQFFISYKDAIKKGDKIANYTALKGIDSHVVEEGKEPRSEFRKDEAIDISIAPGAIIARKTPSVIPVMFGNKVIIELKRKQKDDYLKD